MSNYHNRYGNPSMRRKSKVRKRFIFISLVILTLSIVIGAWKLNSLFFKPNVWTFDKQTTELFIPTGTDFNALKEILFKNGLVIRRNDFVLVSEWMKFDKLIKPGHYLIEDGWSNYKLIRLLRSGAQKPVSVTFNNLRDIYQLSGRVAKQIEADSTSIVQLLTDSTYISFLGYNKQTIPALFLPNTYEFYWTSTAEEFVSRMFQEKQKFWTEERLQKAKELNLNPIEVSTLASIIDKETNKDSEKATIAGVYLNRLKYGWRLQADPTLVFAAGDFEIRRVLDIHKTIVSPYNTYQNPGLPPGPICIPSIASLNAVLNPENHRYFYFCAKDDLSGYHAFAESYDKHEVNAWKYRKALDRMNIKN
jgi:UPF0755 protein